MEFLNMEYTNMFNYRMFNVLRRQRQRQQELERGFQLRRQLARVEERRELQEQRIQIDNLQEWHDENFGLLEPFALYDWISENLDRLFGRNIRIYAQYTDENGILRERTGYRNNFRITNLYDGRYQFRIKSDEEYPFDKVVVIIGGRRRRNIRPRNIIRQVFREGISNCLLTPIIKRFMEKQNAQKHKNAKRSYGILIEKAQKLMKKYKKGVPQEDLQIICNTLKITIEIIQPIFKEQVIFTKPNDNIRSLNRFVFYNTKPNHVECVEGLTVRADSTILDDVSINKKYEELKNKNEYYLIQKYNGRITNLDTLTESYKCPNEINEPFQEFCKINGIHKNLCHEKDFYISEFLRDGDLCNCVATFNFNAKKHFMHIDMEKAYTQGKYFRNYDKNGDVIKEELNPYYMGYLKRIYEFRKVDREMGVGIYQVKNLWVGEKLEALNKKMKIYKPTNKMILSSPELKFIRDMGGEYEIIAGCWGEVGDIEFPKWTFEKHNGIPLYSLFVGLLHTRPNSKEVIVKNYDGFKELLEDQHGKLLNYIQELDGEIRIGYKKTNITHATHIPIFVQAYQRIRLLQQLLEMDIKKIISVITDGIYHKDHQYKILTPFRYEKKDKIVQKESSSFVPLTFPRNYSKKLSKYGEKQTELLAPDPKYQQSYRTEYWSGAGGTGKTYTACNYNKFGTNYIKLAYFTYSHRLRKEKNREFDVPSYTIAFLRGQTNNEDKINTAKIDFIKREHNVLFVDEVSMMLNVEKDEILNLYPNHKIIFSGDVGYQLGSVEKGRRGVRDFNKNNIEFVRPFVKSYRFIEGDPINEVLQNIRNSIDMKTTYDIPLEKFNVLKKDEFLNGNYYQAKDLILAYYNVDKDIFTKHFKHMKKWIITGKNSKYEKGEILTTEDKPPGGVLRHGYTIHCIQGQTTKEKLFIYMNKIGDHISRLILKQLLYTALSRCRSISQVYLVFP